MRILIIGSQGMLGKELVRVCDKAGYETIGWDRAEIDITDPAQDEKILAVAPEILINAAAYNNLDGAETPEGKTAAFLLNGEAPMRLARLTKEINATFVHFSTDYVFAGVNQDGYDENSLPAPISVYGESKLRGERGVINSGANYYLVRLSRLFGTPATSLDAKKSFVDIMITLAQTKTELNLVDEEKSCPTYALDLAAAVLALIIERAPFGIYHLSNTNACTWYEFGKEIFRLARAAGKISTIPAVQPVAASAFPRPARRPCFSELKNTKRPLLRPWQEALAEHIGQI